MNTTSPDTVSSALLAAPYQLNRWAGLLLWTAGNVGCLGNLIVFSSRTFRQRAYSIYLLAEAVSGLIYFDFLLLTRILQRGFQISITTRFEAVCKVRQFASVCNPLISLNLLSFAMIDRICSLQRSNGKFDPIAYNRILSSPSSISAMEQPHRPGLQVVCRMCTILACIFRAPTHPL